MLKKKRKKIKMNDAWWTLSQMFPQAPSVMWPPLEKNGRIWGKQFFVLYCCCKFCLIFGEWWPYTVLRLIPFILCFDFVTSCGFELGGTCVPDMASKESYNKKNGNLYLKLAMAPFVKGKLYCRSQVIMTNINVANPFPPHLPIGDFTL